MATVSKLPRQEAQSLSYEISQEEAFEIWHGNV
jgi:hypothetical protein